jgi:formiminotetrahydrofolate cyclodeaminase
VARDAASVLGLAAVIAEKGNVNAVSDAGSAAGLALAAARAAALNVRINAGQVKDREAARFWLDEISTLEHSLNETFDAISRTIRGRMTSA